MLKWKLQAMNATKRKFNALLNGIGNKNPINKTSTYTQGNTGGHEFTSDRGNNGSEAKKRRISGSVELFNKSESSSSISAHKSNNSPPQKSSPTAIGIASEDAPSFAPWDREAFLNRLESFRDSLKWASKPERVNEVEWAKRGWICKGKERVGCISCNKEIMVKIENKEIDERKEEEVLDSFAVGMPDKMRDSLRYPPDINILTEKAMVDKYVELIVTSHAENCLWRHRGCDDSIFRMQLNNVTTTLKGIRQRYDHLLEISSLLPYSFNLHPPKDFNLELVLSYLPKNFFEPYINEDENETSLEVNQVAIMLALFGWDSRSQAKFKLGAAKCNNCFRTLGLWLFKSKKVNEAGEETEAAAMHWLDPEFEHRPYCPWRNSKAQNAGSRSSGGLQSEDLNGWQTVVRVLRDDFRRREHQTQTLKSQLRAPGEPVLPSESDSLTGSIFGNEEDDEDARSIREEEDKVRWSRLRRIKRVFDTKGVKKLQAVPDIGNSQEKDGTNTVQST